MKTIELKGTSRKEVGKKEAKVLRKGNRVPCVLYGIQKNEEGKPVALPFSVVVDDLRKLIYTPEIFLVNLNIDGKVYAAILKEVQFHAVKDNILHIDFLQVSVDKPIVMQVPIVLSGLAAGVKAGGKLQQAIRKLKVRALYEAIPEKLSVDVTNVVLGKSIKVGDLAFEGLELINPKDTVVCSVQITRASRDADAATPAAE